jgi:hypothetical protein
MSYNKTVNEFQFRWIQRLINPRMPRWISCSMGWWIPVFSSSKVINCIVLGVSILSLITNILFNCVTVSKIWFVFHLNSIYLLLEANTIYHNIFFFSLYIYNISNKIIIFYSVLTNLKLFKIHYGMWQTSVKYPR